MKPTAEQKAKKQFEGKDDQYVEDVFRSTNDAINNDCFSGTDLVLNCLSDVELNRRGYEIMPSGGITIEKR